MEPAKQHFWWNRAYCFIFLFSPAETGKVLKKEQTPGIFLETTLYLLFAFHSVVLFFFSVALFSKRFFVEKRWCWINLTKKSERICFGWEENALGRWTFSRGLVCLSLCLEANQKTFFFLMLDKHLNDKKKWDKMLRLRVVSKKSKCFLLKTKKSAPANTTTQETCRVQGKTKKKARSCCFGSFQLPKNFNNWTTTHFF